MPSIVITLLVLIAIPTGLWLCWFICEFIRYVVSGEYEIDIRLYNLKR